MLTVTDPVLVFTILVLAMLVAPVFSERLRVPDIVLLIGFGALLGPHGLHVLERSEAITLLGAVGLLYIMFLAGLEIDLYRFFRSYKRSLFFGGLTFLIPQVVGTLVGRFLLGLNWPASLLLASMFASHTLLAYPLAGRLGISRSEPVAITVGATIITDTLALLVLAVVADSARGMELGGVFWLTIVLGLAGLTALTWRGIPLAARWFFQRVSEQNNAQFLFVMVALCACAYVSHFARMEPIIGAFLAGAAFNRLIPESSPLMSRVKFIGETIFIPFFLISVGMLVDLRAMLTGPRSWSVGLTMIGAVIGTKYLAAQITRRRFGYSPAAGQVMFGLSVVQAAATLAAAVVGYNLKIFDETVLNGAILMILVTCPLGSWLVDRAGRRMAAETPVQSHSADIGQRLLVPVANPETAVRLLDLAFMLREPTRPGGIYPLTVALDRGDAEADLVQSEKLLGHCLAHAASADIPVEPGLRMAVNVSDGLVQAARELRASSVIAGWAEKELASSRIFGSLARRLEADCTARLLFCRVRRPLNTTRRLLVLFPPQALHRRDLNAFFRDAKQLAQEAGAELRLYLPADEQEALQKAVETVKPSCRMTTVAEAGWNELTARMMEETGPDDLLLLPLDRRGGLLWSPALDRLPEHLAGRFPENNILVDYPSLPGSESLAVEAALATEPEPFEMMPAEVNSGSPLESVLRQMAESVFPDRSQEVEQACRQLGESARSYPVELAPGALLLHARVADPAVPMLMVCHVAEGYSAEPLPVPARIVLVLLGPQTRPPQEHLKMLSAIARRMVQAVQDPAFEKAGSAAELCALLQRHG